MKKQSFMNFFAGALRSEMQYADVSQSKLAETSGISLRTIKRCMSGKYMPSVPTIINLAYALGCGVDDLIDFGETIEGVI